MSCMLMAVEKIEMVLPFDSFLLSSYDLLCHGWMMDQDLITVAWTITYISPQITSISWKRLLEDGTWLKGF